MLDRRGGSAYSESYNIVFYDSGWTFLINIIATITRLQTYFPVARYRKRLLRTIL
jgi:hypothetical protein